MAPAGALIFKLEQAFLKVNVDYGPVQDILRKEQRTDIGSTPQGISPSLLAMKKRLGKKAYEAVRKKAEATAEVAETRALGEAQMHPGVVKMLESVRDTGWWVVAASDMGKRPVKRFLDSKSLSQYMNLVVARSRLDEDRALAKRLRPVEKKLRTLANSVYFCNSSREVFEAKAIGMKCFVLPSPVEPFRTLYLAGPNGIILSLDEIPALLSLPAMKLPAQIVTAPKKKASRKKARSHENIPSRNNP
jgi:beta-phosphoglucomutase-like phosphatase (HAD superfamily)